MSLHPHHLAREPRTLLGVWAHPDDEAYLSAGLMARFRRRGDRVVLVTATRGEHGTSDPAAWPPERLAALRERELRASLAAVGVEELRLLDYEDGFCNRGDGTYEIAEVIEEVAPDLIVTFGPEGMTGHPDHRAVSRWATNARALVRPAATLWYATLTESFHRQWGALNEQIGLWADQAEPPCTPSSELALSVTLPDDLLEQKLAALYAHDSQTRPLRELVGEEAYREWWREESFRDAGPAPLDSSHRVGFDARRGANLHAAGSSRA
jgi:LmbE family N-acetylglucosaminyl deacetylase